MVKTFRSYRSSFPYVCHFDHKKISYSRGMIFRAFFLCLHSKRTKYMGKMTSEKKINKTNRRIPLKNCCKISTPAVIDNQLKRRLETLNRIWGLVQMYAEASKCKPIHGSDILLDIHISFFYHFWRAICMPHIAITMQNISSNSLLYLYIIIQIREYF